MEPHLTPDAVTCIYKALLGRHPESPHIVDQTISLCPSVDALIRDIKASQEYSTNGYASYRDIVHEHYMADGQLRSVDNTSDALIINALFERLAQQWKHLGNSDPYWSVLTDDAFKLEHFHHSQQQFYTSGYENLRVVESFFKRNMISLPRGTCFELGCGVGRVTIPLSTMFERVVGWDVSEGNLALCKQYAERATLGSVQCSLIRSLSDFCSVPEHDFFFSIIVLQHNPPPLQCHILEKVLSKTRPGGYCLFQIPTHTPNYSFSVEKYLSSPTDLMDMHCSPMQTVFSIMAKHGFTPIEVLCDHWTGLYGSHTFFASRS